MFDALQRVLESEPRVAYALLFGSGGRGALRPDSDIDVALGLLPGSAMTALELGDLTSRLETAAGRPVDLVLLNEAPPGLAYRAFKDGRVLLERDRRALVERKARAILEYLDFKLVEDLCSRGVLAARGR